MKIRHKTTKTNYQSCLERIQKANTVDGLYKLESSFDRLYDTGILSDKELYKLSGKVMQKIAKIEVKENE